MTDLLVVYAVGCSWWDTIDKTGRTPPGPSGHRIPCCPHCGSVLYQMDNEAAWWQAVDATAEQRADPDYVSFMQWLRGKCYRGGIREARAVYDREKEIR